MAISQTITVYPYDIPNKEAMTPPEFDIAAQDWVDYQDGLSTELNAWAGQANTTALAISAVSVAADAAIWVSGTTYSIGNVVWSPTDYKAYRRKTNGAGTTDPSADGTNWELVSSFGDVLLDGVQTLTHKTITLGDNTITGTLAQFNAAVTDGDLASLTGSETLTNKTLTSPVINTPAITSPVVTEEQTTLTSTTPEIGPGLNVWTLTGASTPTDGLSNGQSAILMIDDGSAYTITWPSVTWKTDGAGAPDLNTSGYTAISLWKVGGVVYGARVGDN